MKKAQQLIPTDYRPTSMYTQDLVIFGMHCPIHNMHICRRPPLLVYSSRTHLTLVISMKALIETTFSTSFSPSINDRLTNHAKVCFPLHTSFIISSHHTGFIIDVMITSPKRKKTFPLYTSLMLWRARVKSELLATNSL